MDKTLGIKKGYEHYFLYILLSACNLAAVFVFLQPLHALKFCPWIIHIKPRLVCGHNPVNAAGIFCVLIHQMGTEIQTISLVLVSQVVGYLLCCALCQFQVSVKYCLHCAIG